MLIHIYLNTIWWGGFLFFFFPQNSTFPSLYLLVHEVLSPPPNSIRWGYICICYTAIPSCPIIHCYTDTDLTWKGRERTHVVLPDLNILYCRDNSQEKKTTKKTRMTDQLQKPTKLPRSLDQLKQLERTFSNLLNSPQAVQCATGSQLCELLPILEWALMMQWSLSHFFCKQPFTHIPISNPNKAHWFTPNWPLMISKLWSVITYLVKQTSCVLHLPRESYAIQQPGRYKQKKPPPHKSLWSIIIPLLKKNPYTY